MDYGAGHFVAVRNIWQTFVLSDVTGVRKLDTAKASFSTTLGVPGIPGLTGCVGRRIEEADGGRALSVRYQRHQIVAGRLPAVLLRGICGGHIRSVAPGGRFQAAHDALCPP